MGAQRRDVLGLVVGHGMRLALIGVALGLTGAFALTRVLQSLLFEIRPFDPLTFLMATLVLAGVALFSCWIPARRAARVDSHRLRRGGFGGGNSDVPKRKEDERGHEETEVHSDFN